VSEGGSESGDETKRRRHGHSDVDSPATAGDKERKHKTQRFLRQCLKCVFVLLHELHVDTVCTVDTDHL